MRSAQGRRARRPRPARAPRPRRQGSSLCGLGQTAPNPVLSSLQYFRGEFVEHIVRSRCRAAVCRDLVELPHHPGQVHRLPALCPGLPDGGHHRPARQVHNLDPDKCIKCRSCYEVCRFDAIAGDAIVIGREVQTDPDIPRPWRVAPRRLARVDGLRVEMTSPSGAGRPPCCARRSPPASPYRRSAPTPGSRPSAAAACALSRSRACAATRSPAARRSPRACWCRRHRSAARDARARSSSSSFSSTLPAACSATRSDECRPEPHPQGGVATGCRSCPRDGECELQAWPSARLIDGGYPSLPGARS